MTQITYENGKLNITQSKHEIQFRVSDLTHNSRQQLINSIKNIGD